LPFQEKSVVKVNSQSLLWSLFWIKDMIKSEENDTLRVSVNSHVMLGRNSCLPKHLRWKSVLIVNSTFCSSMLWFKKNDNCTTTLIQLFHNFLSHIHNMFSFSLFLFLSLYCFWPIRKENNKVVSNVVPKWLLKYHYSLFNKLMFQVMIVTKFQR